MPPPKKPGIEQVHIGVEEASGAGIEVQSIQLSFGPASPSPE